MDLTKYQKIEIVVQCLEALEMPVQEFEDDLRNFLWWESESNDRLLAHAVHEDVSLTRLGHSERGRACGLLFPVTGDEKHRETVAREIVHSNGGEYPTPGDILFSCRMHAWPNDLGNWIFEVDCDCPPPDQPSAEALANAEEIVDFFNRNRLGMRWSVEALRQRLARDSQFAARLHGHVLGLDAVLGEFGYVESADGWRLEFGGSIRSGSGTPFALSVLRGRMEMGLRMRMPVQLSRRGREPHRRRDGRRSGARSVLTSDDHRAATPRNPNGS